MILFFTVDKQIITRRDNEKVVRDSQNYLYINFSFSEDWTGTKTAVFKGKSGNAFNVLIDENGSCLVPWEVLTEEYFEVSAFCGDLITANVVKVFTIESGYTIGEESRTPTPDIYAQIIARLSAIEAEIDPTAIQQVVDEYLSDKGYVTEQDVEQIVANYIEAHKDELKGDTGATGPQGPQGIQGPKGDTGEGVPTGGTTGQVLMKSSDADYDTEWGDAKTSLDSLTDVDVTNVQSGDALVYDGEKWASENLSTTYGNRFKNFVDNIDIDYEYDSATGANYSVIRIYRDRLDGNKQFPFVYAPDDTEAAQYSTYDLQMKDGWFLAINGGIFNTSTYEPDGIVVENGVVIQNSESATLPQCRPLVIDGNGNMSEAAYDADANTLVQNGAVSVICGFMAIIKDYEAVPQSEWNNISHYTQNAQRQIIGQFGNGDYAIVTCEGRDYQHSDGWTIAEAQTVCLKLGLKFAYNLDGGGSTETMIGFKHFNTIYESTTGRKVPTFIVFNGVSDFGETGRPVVYPNILKKPRFTPVYNTSTADKTCHSNPSRASIWADDVTGLAFTNDSTYPDRPYYYAIEVPNNAELVKVTLPNLDAGVAFYNAEGVRTQDVGWKDASNGLLLKVNTSTHSYMTINIRKSDGTQFSVDEDTTNWAVEFMVRPNI